MITAARILEEVAKYIASGVIPGGVHIAAAFGFSRQSGVKRGDRLAEKGLLVRVTDALGRLVGYALPAVPVAPVEKPDRIAQLVELVRSGVHETKALAARLSLSPRRVTDLVKMAVAAGRAVRIGRRGLLFDSLEAAAAAGFARMTATAERAIDRVVAAAEARAAKFRAMAERTIAKATEFAEAARAAAAAKVATAAEAILAAPEKAVAVVAAVATRLAGFGSFLRQVKGRVFGTGVAAAAVSPSGFGAMARAAQEALGTPAAPQPTPVPVPKSEPKPITPIQWPSWDAPSKRGPDEPRQPEPVTGPWRFAL